MVEATPVYSKEIKLYLDSRCLNDHFWVRGCLVAFRKELIKMTNPNMKTEKKLGLEVFSSIPNQRLM